MELKPYFLSRIGKAIVHKAEGYRPGMPPRRDYDIVPRGVDSDVLLATVGWQDYERDGRKIPGSKVQPIKVAKVQLRGLAGAAEALEDAARLADPDYFVGQPAPRRGPQGIDTDAVDRRLAELGKPEGRAKKEAAPLPGSAARLKAFLASNQLLLLPDVFSSEKGILRARWMHGADRTFWMNFPEKEPLGWSASFPREGMNGLVKVTGRCIEDFDVVAVAALLGSPLTR